MYRMVMYGYVVRLGSRDAVRAGAAGSRAMERGDMRSMDSILADEPSVHTLPDGEEPSGAGADSGAGGVTPEAKGQTEVKAAPEPADKAGDDDESDEGSLPSDAVGLRKALTAERKAKRSEQKQRREFERQLASLQGQISVLKQPQAAPQAQQDQKPGDLDAPWFEGPNAAATKLVRQELQEFAALQAKASFEAQRELVKEQYSDFEEMEALFKEASEDPGIRARLQKLHPSQHPSFAYKIGKQLKQLQGATSVEDIETRIEARIRAEYEAKQGTSSAQAPAKTIPPKSIATARGSGAGVTQAWSGHRSMKDILG